MTSGLIEFLAQYIVGILGMYFLGRVFGWSCRQIYGIFGR